MPGTEGAAVGPALRGSLSQGLPQQLPQDWSESPAARGGAGPEEGGGRCLPVCEGGVWPARRAEEQQQQQQQVVGGLGG